MDAILTQGPDVVLALDRLRALGGDPTSAQVLTFVHLGAPVPKGRARFNPKNPKARPYTPARTLRAERDLLYAFRCALARRPALTDTVAIVGVFYLPTQRRVDVDNCMKLVMDAATKAHVWLDDSQVVAQFGLLELDRARPRTVVALCPAVGSRSRSPLLTERT